MVAMESVLRGKRSWTRLLVLLWLLFALILTLVPPTFAGAWTVWDLGPETNVVAMTDDREGGVWVELNIEVDLNSFDTRLIHVSDAGAFECRIGRPQRPNQVCTMDIA